jgi:hypothetical protein
VKSKTPSPYAAHCCNDDCKWVEVVTNCHSRSEALCFLIESGWLWVQGHVASVLLCPACARRYKREVKKLIALLNDRPPLEESE